ncbi:MAG: glycosyltransferase family 4 protein, partial [Rhodothermales bacterium]|nr:glycosyltransferase family 4 protein [Rhodothermales bacterium]
MHITYVYDVDVPSRQAAPIQILHTARALCERGASVRVLVRSVTAPSEAEALAAYGLDPHPRLGLAAFPLHGWARLTLHRRLRAALQAVPAGARHVVLSRGEPGLALFAHLRRLRGVPPVRRVYEAHRLCFTEVAGRHAPRLPLLRGRGVARAEARVRRLERAAVEGADGLVCLTRGVQVALADLFDVTAPVLILPSGTALPDAPPLPLAARDLDVFYAGKLRRRKGVFDLVAAMRHLPGRRLHVAGGTPVEVEALRRHAAAHGVGERVELLGRVAPAAVGALYRRARVGVCPLPTGESAISERFTSPLKVLEMMAHGVPVVATDVPAIRELLDPGRTALLVEPDRPERLAAGIRTLLEDAGLSARLTRAARAEVERYAWPCRAR